MSPAVGTPQTRALPAAQRQGCAGMKALLILAPKVRISCSPKPSIGRCWRIGLPRWDLRRGARYSSHAQPSAQPIAAGAPALAFLPLPRRFGTKCAGCSQGISPSDLVRKARNKVFHLNCFTCMVCNKQLSTGEELYIIDENKFVCKEDYLNSPSLKEGSLNSGTSGSARPPLRPRRRFLPAAPPG